MAKVSISRYADKLFKNFFGKSIYLKPANFLIISCYFNPSFEYRVTSCELRVSSIEFRVTSFEYRILSYELRVSSVECSNFEYRILSYEFGVFSSNELRVSNFELWVTSFEIEFRVTSFEYQISSIEFRVMSSSIEFRVMSFEYIISTIRDASQFCQKILKWVKCPEILTIAYTFVQDHLGKISWNHLWTIEYRLTGIKTRLPSIELLFECRVELQVTSFESRISSYEYRILSYEFQILNALRAISCSKMA